MSVQQRKSNTNSLHLLTKKLCSFLVESKLKVDLDQCDNIPVYSSFSQQRDKSLFLFDNIINSADILMEVTQPPLIRIYQSCQVLMTIKRKLFQALSIESLPHSPYNEEKRTTSSRVYLYLKKLAKEMRNQLSELSSGARNQSHIELVSKVITDLKNHTQFLSQEEKMIIQANKTVEDWNAVEDPLIYYQQNERAELKNTLNSKLSEINTFSVACRQTKKPLYMRKLERQLKENLCIFAQNQRKYNANQYNLAITARKKIIKLLMKLIEAANNREKSTFVEVDKNLILSRYIDCFQSREGKIKDKDLINYRKDLIKTIKNIQAYFQDEKICLEGLISYLSNIETAIKSFQKQLLISEDTITSQVLDISSDVNYIVDFEDTLEVIHTFKAYFVSSSELNDFRQKLPQLKSVLEDATNQINDYLKTIMKRQTGPKNQEIAQFIEDKKFLQSLAKKQQSFEFLIFDSLCILLEKIYRNRNSLDMKYLEREDTKKFRFQKALSNIFQNYFKEIEKQKSTDAKSTIKETYKLSLNQQIQIKKIEEFIDSLHIFEEEVDWKDSYQCSLGPRLLIHGKMKILPEGIVYISNFNKKNYFFGKTKIFIPKDQIYEINKQSALIIFPDVIEVITKKGGVYFHALGKREKMVQELNEQYFPEVNEAEGDAQEIKFNEFKGDIVALEMRVKPYLQNLEYAIGEGEIPNIDLKTFCHKYQSQEQFHYQGRTYNSFKEYSIGTAGGTNIQGTKFTPGIPYYMLIRDKTTPEPKDIQESERFFTYKKEVPMIPFVSKGGHGICQEKTVYRWGGPKILVVDIYTTLSGFSLTEGMLVRARQIFQEKKNSIFYQFSGEVTFETNSALNNMLRSPALSNLKGFLLDLYEMIKKIEKGRKFKREGSKKHINDEEQSQYEARISQLEQQNARLKKIMFRVGLIALAIYLLTIIVILI